MLTDWVMDPATLSAVCAARYPGHKFDDESKSVCVCVCGVTLLFLRIVSRMFSYISGCKADQESRGLAAYSVMPANEASGIGGSSYGRIALYLPKFRLLKRFIHRNEYLRFLQTCKVLHCIQI